MEQWALAFKVGGIGAGQVSDLSKLCICMYVYMYMFVYVFILT